MEKVRVLFFYDNSDLSQQVKAKALAAWNSIDPDFLDRFEELNINEGNNGQFANEIGIISFPTIVFGYVAGDNTTLPIAAIIGNTSTERVKEVVVKLITGELVIEDTNGNGSIPIISGDGDRNSIGFDLFDVPSWMYLLLAGLGAIKTYGSVKQNKPVRAVLWTVGTGAAVIQYFRNPD